MQRLVLRNGLASWCRLAWLVMIGSLTEFGVCAHADDIRSPTLLRYSATLLESTSNGSSKPVREFEILTLVLPQQGAPPAILYLLEESSDDQPWYEQFGRIEFDAAGRASSGTARQRHRQESHAAWIDLWLGYYSGTGKFQVGQEWEQDTRRYQVTSDQLFQGTPAWQLEINAPQGRRTQLTIHKDAGLIQMAQHRYFAGMGERFDLILKVMEQSTAPTETVSTWETAIRPLLQLKKAIQFDPSTADDLSSGQRAKAEAALDEIDRATDGTPFANLAGIIRREVTAGQQRETAIADLAKRFVGRPAPSITVTPLDGGAPIDLSASGQLTVLHFWGYQEKPFIEPYGQVGYLDFLALRHQEKVRVYGVVTDKRLQSSTSAGNVIRSSKKLREFMNIGYPLVLESGDTLAALGDPTSFGVELPLWIVIDAQGNILHYHVGYYEVDSQRGLEELDSLIKSNSKP